MLKFFEMITVWVGSVASVIVHTIVFACIFFLGLFHFAPWDTLLLVLTTVVSLEAIYLSIFIQMSVNQNTESLKEVEVDVDEIQKDVDEIQRDVDEIQEDVDEIQEDEEAEETRDARQQAMLEQIKNQVQTLLTDIENLKQS